MLRVNHLAGFGKNRPSSGSSYDTDAQAFFTAAGITDTTQKNAVNQLVLDLKSYSIWSKCIAIYPFVGGDSTKHSYNLKNTAAYQITWSGTVTHDSNGVTGNGTTGYGDLGINPSTQMTADDTHMSLYCRTAGATESKSDMGALNGSASAALSLLIRYDDAFSYYANDYVTAGSNTTAANTNAQGFWIGVRRGASDGEGYKNGSTFATKGTANGGSHPNLNIYICGVNFNGTPTERSARNYSFASLGSALSDTEAANYHTAVEAFQDALSRGVV